MGNEANPQNTTALATRGVTLQEPPISLPDLIELFGRSATDESLDLPTRKLAARVVTGFQHLLLHVSRLRSLAQRFRESEAKRNELETKIEDLTNRFSTFEQSVTELLVQWTQTIGKGAPIEAAAQDDDGPIAGPPPKEETASDPLLEAAASSDPADRQIVARLQRGAADDARVEDLLRAAGSPVAIPAAPASIPAVTAVPPPSRPAQIAPLPRAPKRGGSNS